MATAMPSLIRFIEDLIVLRSPGSSPAMGASIMMKPMIVPSRPSFISVSLAKAPNWFEPRNRLASPRSSSV